MALTIKKKSDHDLIEVQIEFDNKINKHPSDHTINKTKTKKKKKSHYRNNTLL